MIYDGLIADLRRVRDAEGIPAFASVIDEAIRVIRQQDDAVEVTGAMVQAALAEAHRVIWSAPDGETVGDVAVDSMRAAVTAALALARKRP